MRILISHGSYEGKSASSKTISSACDDQFRNPSKSQKRALANRLASSRSSPQIMRPHHPRPNPLLLGPVVRLPRSPAHGYRSAHLPCARRRLPCHKRTRNHDRAAIGQSRNGGRRGLAEVWARGRGRREAKAGCKPVSVCGEISLPIEVDATKTPCLVR
jgi:hypothetical protein